MAASQGLLSPLTPWQASPENSRTESGVNEPGRLGGIPPAVFFKAPVLRRLFFGRLSVGRNALAVRFGTGLEVI